MCSRIQSKTLQRHEAPDCELSQSQQLTCAACLTSRHSPPDPAHRHQVAWAGFARTLPADFHSMMQLYTQDFYRDVVQPKLNPDGIFVTQSGPAGVLSSTEVFTAIHTTLRSVFPAVLPYAQHIPSYNDAWVSCKPLHCLSQYGCL